MSCAEKKHDDNLLKRMKALPKVELHRHMSGSVRLSTMKYAYAKFIIGDEEKMDSVSRETVYRHFCITSQVDDLSQCMDRFVHTQAIFQDYDIIQRVAFEVVEDCALDNVRIFELRYSPQYIQQANADSLTLEGVHEATMKGIKRACEKYPAICVGVIGILDRHLPLKMVEKSAKFMFEHKDDFIALDLANDEANFDCMLFKHIFVEARELGMHVTIHSGEVPVDAAPQWVKNAIEHLGAERIGHGLHIIRDSAITEWARERDIVFEICPTSNYLVNSVPSLESHPVSAMLTKHKLRVTLNTDDPGLFAMESLSMELVTCIEKCGLSEEQVVAAQDEAYRASFIPENLKSKHWKKGD